MVCGWFLFCGFVAIVDDKIVAKANNVVSDSLSNTRLFFKLQITYLKQNPNMLIGTQMIPQFLHAVNQPSFATKTTG